ncbi:hypothetical protein LENED_006493 [Lentinula edodes]|uniref:Uncharacterized protein n=1 Tax=Lentinula edodes TaxID=5353 RepID=A0A1Q3EBT0_LENED|nr:hypothetical protein LENED_006493 [Lentinula edodes]
MMMYSNSPHILHLIIIFSCVGGTLDLYDIVRSFYGGVEEFVQSSETSVIKDLNDLSFDIKVDLEAVHLNELADVFAEAGPFFEGKIFEDIFNDFLEGTGAPCPQLLHAIRDRSTKDYTRRKPNSGYTC